MNEKAKVVLCLIVILGLGWRCPAQSTAGPNIPVTPVTGESWLNHIHRTFAETSMGKTWRLGPAVPEPGMQPESWQPLLPVNSRVTSVTVHGSDLYRMNCQGCHGASGQGAPPEINSLIDPVRATSVGASIERMKKTGQEMSYAEAKKMAWQARASLLQRLHGGGENMPAFPHLSQKEIGVLMGYLKELAGINGAESRRMAVRESPVRIGEMIAKSTCHTCHGARGINPTAEQLMEGVIPPLSTLPIRVSEEGLIRKVTDGAPIEMGTPR